MQTDTRTVFAVNRQPLLPGNTLGCALLKPHSMVLCWQGDDFLAADRQHLFPAAAALFTLCIDAGLAHRCHRQAGLGVEVANMLVAPGIALQQRC